MALLVTCGFDDYEPWSGAVDFYREIEREGKLDHLEMCLEELYPDGCSLTTINDTLWFEEDMVREWLDMPTEEQKQQQIREEAAEWWEEECHKYCKFGEDLDEMCDVVDCQECPCFTDYGGGFNDCQSYRVALENQFTFDDVVEMYKEAEGID